MINPLISNNPISIDSDGPKPLNLEAVICNQFDLQFNLIRVDKGKFLAPRGQTVSHLLTAINSEPCIAELINEFEVWLFATRGRKRGIHRNTYTVALAMLLANAKEAYQSNAQCLLGRKHDKHLTEDNPLKITSKTTNKLLEFMASEGLIAYVIGKDNEYDNNSSWFIPLNKLIQRIENAVVRAANGGQVVVCRERRNKKQKGERPPIKLWSKYNHVRRKVKSMSKAPTDYNLMMNEHSVTSRKRDLVTFLYRSFTESIELGGRFYSPWQSMPKADRYGIRIDGQRTIEQDYGSQHWMLIYSWAGLQFPLDKDPYIVEGYDRGVIKTVSLVLLNTDNTNRLAIQITYSGTAEAQELYKRWKIKAAHHQLKRDKGLIDKPPKPPQCLEAYIDGIPLGTSGTDLVDALLDRHSSVRDLLGKPDIGLRLQRQDSDIMAGCIADCAALNIPILTIHDSIICLKKDRGLVYGIMMTRYEVNTGFKINIREADPPLKLVRNQGEKVLSLPLF